jgi:4-alpha-glucanotransferase
MSTIAYPRRSGLLLHPTSLPGPYGVGDLGDDAFRWIDTLARANQTLWQVLPLGPTGFGDSPYQCFSAMAGNPYLISPDRLYEDGLLTRDDLAQAPSFPDDHVDFGPVIEFKRRILDAACARYRVTPASRLTDEYRRFREQHAHWLDDFALFMALKQSHGGRPWTEWDPALRERETTALDEAHRRLLDVVEAQRFLQFLFFRQWNAVRDSAHAAGVRIIGDIPIFVAHDSADVWAHRELFKLDAAGRPTVVAGVPPDYFAKTGQLWGNPIYRWEQHAATGFRWWIERIRATLETVDLVRLDHFRGFEAYYEVPADAPTAEQGSWVKGPGSLFFDSIRGVLGNLPLLAEDLGFITPPVRALRDKYDLPGMKILQFGFGDGATHEFLPHNFSPHCVAYTGSHDNEPARAWYENAPEHQRDHARRYLQCDDSGFTWALIRAAEACVAHTAIVQLQDVLELGEQARMNLPGRPAGNWSWRFRWDELEPWRVERMGELSALYGRLPAAYAAKAKEDAEREAETAPT